MLENILLFGLSLACGVGGWLIRELWGAVQTLRKELAVLEVKIGTDYVRYDRLQDALKPIMETLAEIKLTMIRKMDK